jgi:hypothetical protein
MTVRTWIRRLFDRKPRTIRKTIRKEPVRFRPRLEQLESRVVPTVHLLGNFDSVSSGATPPDTCGAAGPQSYIESGNAYVNVYNKGGTSLASDSLSDFFYTKGGLKSNGALSDATMVYNEVTGQFIVGDMDVAWTVGGGNAAALDIAVSKNSNPGTLDSSSWNFYQIDMTEANEHADYPGNMGYNKDAFVFTFNEFDTNDHSGHVQVAAISQSSLAAGGSLTINRFDVNGFNWRPVTMHDSTSGGPMWFVTEHGNNQSIDLVRIDNILTSPTGLEFNILVNPYGAANDPLNPDGTPIEPPSPLGPYIDTRIMKAAEANNDIVACQHVGVGNNEDDARWYEFNVSDINNPYLVQQGNVGFGAKTYTVYPSIDINPNGDIAMGFTRSGNDTSTDYMSTYITGWRSGDPAGTMETPVEVKAGSSNYNGGREGDFSGINVDPNDNTFWVNDEYSSGSTSHQEIANFSMDTQNFYVVNGQLTVYGDQLGANYNDSVTIGVDGSGGVVATLNGETATFYPGQITSIWVVPYGGNNTVNINATLASAPVTLFGTSNDTYVLTPSSDNLNNIQGTVSIFGPGSRTLTVDDQNDSANGDIYQITDAWLQRTGEALIAYSGLSSLTVNGSSTANITYDVTSIPAPLTINAGTGSNTLTLENQNDSTNGDTYAIADGSVQRTGLGLISYSGISSVIINGSSTANDGYAILSTAASTPLTINAGNGANIFVMTPFNDLLSNIQGAVTLNAGTGSNTLTVDDQNDTSNGDTYTIASGSVQRNASALISYGGSFSSVTVNGSSTANITYDINGTVAATPVTVNAGNGANTFVMAPSTDYLDYIQGTVTLHAGTGSNALIVDDQNDPYFDTYTIASGSVQRNASALISYSAGFSSATVNGSSTANITYDINSTVAGTPVTVNAGNGANSFVMTPASQFLDNIQGGVTLHAGTGSNTLTVDDQNDPYDGDTYTIASGSVQRNAEALISYGGTFSSVIVNGSSTNNITYNINSTAAGTPLTVNAGNGANVVNLAPSTDNLNNLAGAVTVNAGSASTVNVDDQNNSAAATYTVTSTTVSRAGFGGLTYAGLGALVVNGGSHADTYNVQSTASVTAVTVNGGVGSDTFTLGSGNSLGGIQGALTVNGGGGTNTLTANDSSSASGQPYVLSSTQLLGKGFATITYASMHALKLTGSGNDALILVSPVPTVATTFNGGIGTNKLFGANVTNAWTISGTNSGKLDSVTFSNVQDLVGGTGVDTFTFSTSGKVASINGGGAPAGQGDWLNYASLPSTSTVTVNLATGSATNVNGGAAGAVSNIQNVIGSASGTNNLTGSSQGNILIGGSGTNTLVGGSGNSLLIGGSGHGSITGGGGSDILIAGTTTFNAATTAGQDSLMAILAELQSADTFADKVFDIIHGTNSGDPAPHGQDLNGKNKLTWLGTVKASTGSFTLSGDTGLSSNPDWFFSAKSSTVTDFDDDGVQDEHNNNALGVL